MKTGHNIEERSTKSMKCVFVRILQFFSKKLNLYGGVFHELRLIRTFFNVKGIETGKKSLTTG